MGFLALGTALSMLAFYVFLTRMHERYAFGAFLPFLAACMLLNSRLLWAGFIAASTVHFLNLYHVFGSYYFFNAEQRGNFPDWIRVEWLYNWLGDYTFLGVDWPLVGPLETIQVLSAAFVAAFLAVVAAGYFLSQRSQARPSEAT
jgi:hypothetical protein